MPEKERYECPECGKLFGSEETLEEHTELEHGSQLVMETPEMAEELEALKKALSRMKPGSGSSFIYGFFAGALLVAAAVGGVNYWQSLDHRTTVPVTVVTCDNCSYGRFQNATDRMFNARYTEVDYRTERGQELIQKYNLKYVPGFIFDRKQLEKAENFDRVRSVLVKFDDAYVVPDERTMVAQRLSEGKRIDRQG